MAEEQVNKMKTPHCLILPFPMQGHINPMLQFAKRLVHKGVKASLILTRYMAKTTPFSSPTIGVETISDGLDGGAPSDMPLGEYVALFNDFGPKTFMEAVKMLKDSGRPADCVVYDPFVTWALAAAKESALTAAAFFTQSCAVDYIYHSVSSGTLKVPLAGESEISLPGLPLLRREDMPSFFNEDSDPFIFQETVDQFKNIGEASWVFSNTFYELEQQAIDSMSETTPVKPIGPAIPSIYLDKRLPEDTEYGFNVFRPNAAACIEWLNRQEPESVVYVSFGSFAKMNEGQMEEVAWGLKLSGKPFLWVVRSSEQSKLPENFSSEEKGLIVSWCPQLDVLAHEATSCFVTHCGWNSTLEAVCLGVPMIALPQWSDQSTNSKFVMDVWRTGVRAAAGPDGLIGRETIQGCIREVMDGERGREMKKNAAKWRELARAAMDEGGSSDTNIQDFISSLSVSA